MPDEDLRRVLTAIRVRGGIGSQSIDDAIAHSERFVAACPDSARLGVDVGSGGGLPALVLAVRRPALQLHLIERRATRADLLRYGVTALGLEGQVSVHTVDVAHTPSIGLGNEVDLVTARSFAALPITLGIAASILGASGSILVSAPPHGVASIDAALLEQLRLERAATVEEGILVFVRR